MNTLLSHAVVRTANAEEIIGARWSRHQGVA